MGTLLITGGAGFIGSNLVHYALDHTADRLVVFDKLTYAGSLLNLDGAAEEPARDVRAGRHRRCRRGRAACSRRIGRPRSSIWRPRRTSIARSTAPVRSSTPTSSAPSCCSRRRGTFAAGLDPAARAAFRFLHVSTDEVYGTLGASGLFSEETPYAPNSPYAASKAAADHLVRASFHTYGLPVLITNCSNNYGPFQFPEKLIPLMMLNALDGRPLPIYGDGGNVRDWLHVEDHCAGILLVLAKGRLGEKYNIGGGNERTNLEIVDRICDAVEAAAPGGRRTRRSRVPRYRDLKTFVPDRPGHDRRYAIDATQDPPRARLGAAARVSKRGWPSTARWYLEHRDWCEQVQAGVRPRAAWKSEVSSQVCNLKSEI